MKLYQYFLLGFEFIFFVDIFHVLLFQMRSDG